MGLCVCVSLVFPLQGHILCAIVYVLHNRNSYHGLLFSVFTSCTPPCEMDMYLVSST
jgi:hypothetical protein